MSPGKLSLLLFVFRQKVYCSSNQDGLKVVLLLTAESILGYWASARFRDCSSRMLDGEGECIVCLELNVSIFVVN